MESFAEDKLAVSTPGFDTQTVEDGWPDGGVDGIKSGAVGSQVIFGLWI
jgi:hypothetical protein